MRETTIDKTNNSNGAKLLLFYSKYCWVICLRTRPDQGRSVPTRRPPSHSTASHRTDFCASKGLGSRKNCDGNAVLNARSIPNLFRDQWELTQQDAKRFAKFKQQESERVPPSKCRCWSLLQASWPLGHRLPCLPVRLVQETGYNVGLLDRKLVNIQYPGFGRCWTRSLQRTMPFV